MKKKLAKFLKKKSKLILVDENISSSSISNIFLNLKNKI